jgi:hypothetical protein
MTNVGDGYWVIDVPLAAGANQYWFYVNNNTNLWVTDPANSPVYAPDGLTGNARRAFNKVYVPYDAEKQNFAPCVNVMGPIKVNILKEFSSGTPTIRSPSKLTK